MSVEVSEAMSEETKPEETTPKPPETEAQSEANAPENAEAKPAKSPTSEAAADGEKPARAPKAKADGDGDAKPAAAKAKKEKPPALEDKPFQEFITQHYLPGLTQTLGKLGIQDLDLKLEQAPLPVAGLGDAPYWQVIGHWQNGQRQFNIIFLKENIQGPKYFCYADNGASPSTLESFMIDERKVSLDLLLLYTVQRLNGQKWLVRN
jgi:hypothetical protein